MFLYIGGNMEYLDKLKNALVNDGYDIEYQRICIEYARNLITNEVPVIFDKEHLSCLMGMKLKTLSYYFMNKDKFYKVTKIPKRNGKYREISMPSYNLKKIQRWILDNILYKVKISDSACGFVRGKSIFNNAVPHIGKDFVVNIDIQDFFPSINLDQIFIMFYKLGYTKELSFIFASLLSYKGVLPQGSPASPYIANIIVKNIDRRIEGLCNKFEVSYTRYADDITLSGSVEVIKYIETVKKIIQEEGFIINENKVKIQHKFYRQEVTGLVVNKTVKVKKEFKRKLRQHIYYCKKYGVYQHLKHNNLESKSFYKEYLYGHAYFIKMVEPDVGNIFIKQLNEINWNY